MLAQSLLVCILIYTHTQFYTSHVLLKGFLLQQDLCKQAFVYHQTEAVCMVILMFESTSLACLQILYNQNMMVHQKWATPYSYHLFTPQSYIIFHDMYMHRCVVMNTNYWFGYILCNCYLVHANVCFTHVPSRPSPCIMIFSNKVLTKCY